MINISRLVRGRGTVSEVLAGGDHPGLARFSSPTAPVVVWNVTWRCNLSCIHCYLPGGGRGELTRDEALSLVDELADAGVRLLLLSGGEPLLREDLLEIARRAADMGIRVGLSTNGTLITRGVAEKLKRAGIAYVGISLDGASPGPHDAIRGVRGSFDAALRGLRNCVEAGLSVGLRTVVLRRNLGEVPRVVELAARMGVKRICFYHFVPAGRGGGCVGDDIGREERRRLVEYLYGVARENPDVEVLTVCNPSDGVLVCRLLERDSPDDARHAYRLLRMMGGCSAGRRICCIAPDGTVHPCQFMYDVSLGNVREGFREVWRRAEELRWLRDRSMLIGACGSCPHRDVCGGCRARALYAAGSHVAEDPGCVCLEA